MADAREQLADNAGVIAPPPLIALATLLLGLALDWLAPAYILLVLLSWPTRIVLALLLVPGGAALAIYARREFMRAGTEVKPWLPATQIVTTGPYAYLRNPMYVSLGLMTAGFAFLFASDWTLVLLVPAGLLIHYGVVRREERYLDRKFGETYRAYRLQVRRYGWPKV